MRLMRRILHFYPCLLSCQARLCSKSCCFEVGMAVKASWVSFRTWVETFNLHSPTCAQNCCWIWFWCRAETGFLDSERNSTSRHLCSAPFWRSLCVNSSGHACTGFWGSWVWASRSAPAFKRKLSNKAVLKGGGAM